MTGLKIRPKLVFEPQYLAANLPPRTFPKSKVGPIKIVIYGRPGVPRNLFVTLITSLDIALQKYPKASFDIISLGEKHTDVLLESGYVVRSLGKLPEHEYIALLSTADLGISLMMSPHPSYPPLEMASAGMLVITNDFFGYKRNLSDVFPNIHVVDPTVEQIADKITEVISKKSTQLNVSKGKNILGRPINEVTDEVIRLIDRLK